MPGHPFDISQLWAMSAEELEQEIRYHNRRYWDEAAPEIADTDYDQLVLQLNFTMGAHPAHSY